MDAWKDESKGLPGIKQRVVDIVSFDVPDNPQFSQQRLVNECTETLHSAIGCVEIASTAEGEEGRTDTVLFRKPQHLLRMFPAKMRENMESEVYEMDEEQRIESFFWQSENAIASMHQKEQLNFRASITKGVIGFILHNRSNWRNATLFLNLVSCGATIYLPDVENTDFFSGVLDRSGMGIGWLLLAVFQTTTATLNVMTFCVGDGLLRVRKKFRQRVRRFEPRFSYSQCGFVWTEEGGKSDWYIPPYARALFGSRVTRSSCT